MFYNFIQVELDHLPKKRRDEVLTDFLSSGVKLVPTFDGESIYASMVSGDETLDILSVADITRRYDIVAYVSCSNSEILALFTAYVDNGDIICQKDVNTGDEYDFYSALFDEGDMDDEQVEGFICTLLEIGHISTRKKLYKELLGKTLDMNMLSDEVKATYKKQIKAYTKEPKITGNVIDLTNRFKNNK